MSDIVTDHVDQSIDDFKKYHGVHHIIAFSGGTSISLPGISSEDPLSVQYERIQKEREQRIVRHTLNILRHYRVAVLTGGTRFGFPKTAVEVAKEMNIRTIGVFPEVAVGKEYVLRELDLAICISSHCGESVWGDESSVFCKLLDAVIVCGGGAGTLIEVAHLLKMNEGLLKSGHPMKVIVPIHGTGGVADGLPFIWGKQEIKNSCMPQKLVFSGTDAAVYIQEHLDLFNIEP